MAQINKYTLVIFTVCMILCACHNENKKSVYNNCYKSDTLLECISLIAFDEPCFRDTNSCQNYYRLIYSPPFDSCLIIAIHSFDGMKYKAVVKHVSNNEYRIDNLLKKYGKGLKGNYRVEQKDVTSYQLDTLISLLSAEKVFEQSKEENWLDPVRWQIDMNQDGYFRSVYKVNPTDSNYLKSVRYFIHLSKSVK